MAHFDVDGDGRVVYDAALAFAAGLGTLTEEFAGIDDQLGHLIDFAFSDRNGDELSDETDVSLGYSNGVIDANDMYAKVAGRLSFAVTQADWENARDGSYQQFVEGPIKPDVDEAPVTFEVDEDDLLDITTADWDDSDNWLKDKALAGQDFDAQVAAGVADGGTYTPEAGGPHETVPYGARGYYDWYQRPVYEDMTFTDLTIPMGNNGLFINCTFIGATYLQTYSDNTDPNWNYVGMVDRNPNTGLFEEKYPGLYVTVDGTDVYDTRDYSNNVRFHDCTFAGSVVADAPLQYTHVRNKVQYTGNTTFTLDHPDLTEADKEELAKSSILMPGYSVDVGNFTNNLGENVQLQGTIIAGVMDVRGSADVHGTLLMTFRPTEAEGPLFYGGTPDGFNTTVGYFGPDEGDAESVDPSTLIDTDDPPDGIPDIGMDLDGDGVNDPFEGFGEITLRYDPDAKLPNGIPWPILIEPEPGTYSEGGDS
jgi:hypothetical protein